MKHYINLLRESIHERTGIASTKMDQLKRDSPMISAIGHTAVDKMPLSLTKIASAQIVLALSLIQVRFFSRSNFYTVLF